MVAQLAQLVKLAQSFKWLEKWQLIVRWVSVDISLISLKELSKKSIESVSEKKTTLDPPLIFTDEFSITNFTEPAVAILIFIQPMHLSISEWNSIESTESLEFAEDYHFLQNLETLSKTILETFIFKITANSANSIDSCRIYRIPFGKTRFSWFVHAQKCLIIFSCFCLCLLSVITNKKTFQ